MYTLIRLIPLRQLLVEQAPALAVSLFIAELFYKFHSFTLECVAFLVTWFIVSYLASFISSALSPSKRLKLSRTRLSEPHIQRTL